MNKTINDFFERELKKLELLKNDLDPNDIESKMDFVQEINILKEQKEYFLNNPSLFQKFKRDYDYKKALEKYKNKYPLKYIDNDLFILPNKSKKFTAEECVALIIRNKTMTLNQKFIELKSSRFKDLRKEINDWIKYKKYCVKYLMNFDNEKVRFLHEKSVDKLYRNLKDLIDNTCDDIIVVDETARLAEISVCSSFSDDVFDRIIDVNIGKMNAYSDFNYYYSPLYDIKVELNNSFKPFDLVYIPSFTYSYTIIADKKDEKVMELFELNENKKNGPEDMGWLKLGIANYYLETNLHSNNGVKPGELTQSLYHNYYMFSLKDIKIIDEKSMTVYQKEMIDRIKKMYKERKK